MRRTLKGFMAVPLRGMSHTLLGHKNSKVTILVPLRVSLVPNLGTPHTQFGYHSYPIENDKTRGQPTNLRYFSFCTCCSPVTLWQAPRAPKAVVGGGRSFLRRRQCPEQCDGARRMRGCCTPPHPLAARPLQASRRALDAFRGRVWGLASDAHRDGLKTALRASGTVSVHCLVGV